MLQPLAQIQTQRIISFLLYLNNFQVQKETLQQNHTVLCRAALSGPERAPDTARWRGRGAGRAHLESRIPFSSWTLSTNHYRCFVYCIAIYILEPGVFNSESQYFITLFNRISLLCIQHPTGDEASNGGCNSCPTGHDFQDNSNICIFITMRIGPFGKCETGLVFKLDAGENLSGFHSPVLIGCDNLHFGSHHGCRIWFSLAGFQFLDYFRIRGLWVWMKSYKTLFINTL